MLQLGHFVLFFVVYTTGVLGQVYIAPSDTIYEFVNSSATFHCYHRTDESSNIIWLVNGTNLTESPLREFSSISEFSGGSYLIIDPLMPEFNNTSINCNALTSFGTTESSQNIDIILQGLLSKVNAKISINGSYLILLWNPPYSVYGEITYNVTERRQSHAPSIKHKIEQPNYSVGLISEIESECTDYVFVITPVNLLGPGQESTISIINEDVSILNYSRSIRDLDQNFNLLIEFTTIICAAKIMCTYLNPNFDSQVIDEFSLNAASQDHYQYLFNLNLTPGFVFHLGLQLNNSRGLYVQNITLSTHNIRDIEINVIMPGLLKIKPIYYNDSIDLKWSFVSLLQCSNMECTEIDFDNSIYIVIKNEQYDVSFSSGLYQVYAFDVNNKGAIHPSFASTAYPAYNQKKKLIFNGGSYNSLPNSRFCSYVYDSGMICSHCNLDSDNQSKMQQIVLLPKNYNNLITDSISISKPTRLNLTTCLKNTSNHYYVITILVTLSDDNISKYPIAQELISSIQSTIIHDNSEDTSISLILVTIGLTVISMALVISSFFFIVARQHYKVKANKEISSTKTGQYSPSKRISAVKYSRKDSSNIEISSNSNNTSQNDDYSTNEKGSDRKKTL